MSETGTRVCSLEFAVHPSLLDEFQASERACLKKQGRQLLRKEAVFWPLLHTYIHICTKGSVKKDWEQYLPSMLKEFRGVAQW